MSTLVLTHAGCFDGHTAAWVYSRFVDMNAEFIACRYGDPVPEVAGRNVVIADFSWPRAQMKSLIWAARDVVVLDHHKSAEEALFGLVDEMAGETDHVSAAELRLSTTIVFDMSRSGAGLVWDHFCGEPARAQRRERTRPALVDYVEDRDLWRNALPESKRYMANVYAAPMTFEGWDVLHSRSVVEMVGSGGAILEYMHEYGTKALAEARVLPLRPFFIGGMPHAIEPPWTVNLPYMNCSDYLSRLMDEKGTDFVMGYFRRRDGRWQFSLRSRNGFDCSVIAKVFGGGGHKGAAGFDVASIDYVFQPQGETTA